jgi:hypothetical protein
VHRNTDLSEVAAMIRQKGTRPMSATFTTFPGLPQFMADPPVALANECAAPSIRANDRTLLGVVELLLKAPARMNELIRKPEREAEFIQRFLAIALASFGIFGLGLALLLASASPAALPGFMMPHWARHPWASSAALWLAYTLGFNLATGICLPSFYFYALLAGVRVSVLQVTAQIMKGKSATCLMLMGILPIYVAIVLGAIVFELDADHLRWAIWLGLVLPFIAGVWGLHAIYEGFLSLADTIGDCRRGNRLCFLRRLTFCCTLCYACVAPVMIYTLWKYMVLAWG